MDNIPEAADRKALHETILKQDSDPVALAERAAIEASQLCAHYERVIANWCSNQNPDTLRQTELSLPVNNTIPCEALDNWETALVLKGYNVNRGEGLFVVAMPV